MALVPRIRQQTHSFVSNYWAQNAKHTYANHSLITDKRHKHNSHSSDLMWYRFSRKLKSGYVDTCALSRIELTFIILNERINDCEQQKNIFKSESSD